MTDYSVVIDLILNGIGSVDDLAKALSRLKRSGKDAEQTAGSFTKIETAAKKAKTGLEETGEAMDRGANQSLAYARAMASLQATQGNLAAASATLRQALRREQEDTAATINAKRQLAQLEAKLSAQQSKGANDVARNQGVVVSELRKVETQTLNTARAQASLLAAQGQQAQAVNVLKGALSQVTQQTVAVTAAKRQLAATEAQLSTAASKHEAQLLREAQLLARIRQLKGDQAGGAAILQNALNKVNPNSLNALRAKIQQIYFDTNYQHSPLISSIRNLQGNLSGLTPFFGRAGSLVQAFAGQAGQAATAIEGVGAASTASAAGVGVLLGGLIAIAGTVAGIVAVAGAIKSIGEAGIEANRELEVMRFGVAAVIAGTQEISKNGVPVEGAEKFAASFALAGEQIEKIIDDAQKLGVPVNEVVDGFQRALGPLGRMGVNLDDARKVTLGIVVAMRDIGIPLQEIGQETRALLNGETSKLARLNQQLGIHKQDIELWRKEGDLAQKILERLKDYTLAGEAFRKSFEGGIQASRAAFGNFTRDVTRNLFETLRDKMAAVFDDIDAQGGLKKAFGGISQTLTSIFEIASGDASDLIDNILEGVKRIDAFLGDNQDIIDQILVAVDEIGRLFVDIVGAVFDWNDLQEHGRTGLEVTLAVVKTIVQVLGIVRDTWRVIVEVIKTAGAQLSGVVLTAIFTVANTLARLLRSLPLVGDFAAEAANRLGELAKEAFGAAATHSQKLKQEVSNFGVATAASLERIDQAESTLERKRRERARNRSKQNDVGGLGTKGKPSDEDKEKKAKTQRALKENAEETLKAEQALQKAVLALKNAFFEQQQQDAKANLDKENALLDLALEDRLISLNDFFKKKKNLLDESTDLELKAVQRQREQERGRFAEIDANANKEEAAARREAARQLEGAKGAERRASIEENLQNKLRAISDKAETERLEVDKKIVELDTEAARIRAKNSEDNANNTRKEIVARRELREELQNAGNELRELTGDKLGASLEQIDQRFDKLLATVRLNFGSVSTEVQLLIALIEQLKANAKLDDVIRQTRNAQAVAEATLDLQRTGIDNKLLDGLINERQARQEILNVQRQYVALVLPAIEAEIQATRALGKEHEAEAIALEAKAARLRQLTIDVDALNRRVAKGLEDELLTTLDKLGDQITTLGELWRSLVEDILKGIKRLTAEKIDDFLFGGRTNKETGEQTKGPIPSIIDKVLGIFGVKTQAPGGTGPGLPGIGGQSPEIAATNANTQALNALTQALGGTTAAIGGAGAADPLQSGIDAILGGGAGSAPEGDFFNAGGLGGLIGGVVGAVSGGGEGAGIAAPGGQPLNAVLADLVKVIDKLNITLGATGAGGLVDSFLGNVGGIVTGIIGAFSGEGEGEGGGGFGGGLLGGLLGGDVAEGGNATNILDAINEAVKAINQNTKAMKDSSQGGGGMGQLFQLALAGGFDSGGFTGFGNIAKAAGIVHGGEYVFSAPAVDNLGLGWLERVHQAARQGYETGGLVAVHRDMSNPGTTQATGGNRGAVTVINAATDDEIDEAAQTARARGDKVFVNKMFRNRRALNRIQFGGRF